MTLANRWSAAPLFMLLALAMGAALLVEPQVWLGILVLPGLIAAAWIARGTLHSSKPAMYTMIFIAAFVIEATTRIRDVADKSVDYQVAIKVGVWVTIFLISLVQIRRWLPHMMRPTNIPVLMFLAWLFFTATVSPIPAYSAGAVFSICANILFCAAIFATFERVEIFAVMTLAMTVLCVLSIIVYFTYPELGRFIYWVDGYRYTSMRLSGLGGSANNMGRLAAFGLVLVILYAREFHRIHRWFVPISAVVLGVSVLLTNSRGCIGMVIALWAGTYLLRWHRLYLLILGVSVLLIGAVVAIPAGDEALKMLSRSGDAREVTSITGRSTIWQSIPGLVAQRPWTGHGYASSIVFLPQQERAVGFLTTHAHNLVLQLLLTSGWIGLGLFCLSLLTVGVRLAYFADRTGLVMFSFVLLNGLTEASAFSTFANICTLAFAIAVTLPPEQRNHENHRSY
jgi:exopolysaccharide production protein ExoQ